jgi:hypothetical protein
MPPETPAVDSRAWAARQLGVPADTLPAAVRAVFRQRLPDEDFVPPPTWQQAVAVLTGVSPPASVRRAAAEEEEEQLRPEIETFADRFFSYPPEERGRRWQELADRSEFAPALTARLLALEPGLSVSCPGGEEKDEAVACLAGHVRELFVLRPAERAYRRHVLFQQMQADRAKWQKTAGRLRQAHAGLAALQPEWVGELAEGDRRRRPAAKVRHRPRRRAAAPAERAGSGGGRFPWWAWFLVLGVLRACAGLTNSPSTRPDPAQPVRPPVNWRTSDQPPWGKGGNGVEKGFLSDPEVKRRVEDLLKKNRSAPSPAEPWKPAPVPRPGANPPPVPAPGGPKGRYP